LPLEIPDFIDIDISKLNIGDTIRVSDLEINEKFKFETSEDVLIVSVTQPMKEEVTTDEDDAEILDGEAAEASDGEEAKTSGSDDKNDSKSEDNS
jgi:large subunit ribosomal protein L25